MTKIYHIDKTINQLLIAEGYLGGAHHHSTYLKEDINTKKIQKNLNKLQQLANITLDLIRYSQENTTRVK